MATYQLISSDSHIIEPADLWQERIDRTFRDRAPRLVHEAEADQWYADGVKFGAIGINQQAGVRFETPEHLTLQGRMATVPRGGFDPHAHVQDMDRDTVAGGVLYPSQGLTTYRIPDSALLSAIFRAYNDWLADFCQPYPQRLKVGAVEFEVAWAPYFLARMDNLCTEQAIGVHGRHFKGDAIPSDFFRQNIFLSFQEDAVGIQLRALLGVETLLWGSDYPHAESTFPRSRAIVERILQGVPDEEKAQIAGGNTARLYRFN